MGGTFGAGVTGGRVGHRCHLCDKVAKPLVRRQPHQIENGETQALRLITLACLSDFSVRIFVKKISF